MAPGNNNIVRELILDNDICNDLRNEPCCWIRQRPVHHILQILLSGYFRFNFTDSLWGEFALIHKTYCLYQETSIERPASPAAHTTKQAFKSSG